MERSEELVLQRLIRESNEASLPKDWEQLFEIVFPMSAEKFFEVFFSD